MILVDDQTGVVLMDVDHIAEAENRVVCDNDNVSHSIDRAEHSVRERRRRRCAPSQSARGLGRGQHRFRPRRRRLRQLPGLRRVNLTNLIGRVVDGASGKKLAPTVRWCYTGARPARTPTRSGTASRCTTARVRRRRRRRRPRDDPRRHRAHLEPLLLGPVRGHERVDLRHHGRDHRPPERHGGRVPDQTGRSARTSRASRAARATSQDPTLVQRPRQDVEPALRRGGRRTCGLYPDEDGVHTNSGVGNKTVLPDLPGRGRSTGRRSPASTPATPT